jgi:hypothetical protein
LPNCPHAQGLLHLLHGCITEGIHRFDIGLSNDFIQYGFGFFLSITGNDKGINPNLDLSVG